MQDIDDVSFVRGLVVVHRSRGVESMELRTARKKNLRLPIQPPPFLYPSLQSLSHQAVRFQRSRLRRRRRITRDVYASAAAVAIAGIGTSNSGPGPWVSKTFVKTTALIAVAFLGRGGRRDAERGGPLPSLSRDLAYMAIPDALSRSRQRKLEPIEAVSSTFELSAPTASKRVKPSGFRSPQGERTYYSHSAFKPPTLGGAGAIHGPTGCQLSAMAHILAACVNEIGEIRDN